MNKNKTPSRITFTLSSGITNPRDYQCGYFIRASRRPAVKALWITNPQGQTIHMDEVVICFRCCFNVLGDL